AISLIGPGAASAEKKSRGGLIRSASARTAASDRAAFARSISMRLVATILSRMVDTLIRFVNRLMTLRPPHLNKPQGRQNPEQKQRIPQAYHQRPQRFAGWPAEVTVIDTEGITKARLLQFRIFITVAVRKLNNAAAIRPIFAVVKKYNSRLQVVARAIPD